MLTLRKLVLAGVIVAAGLAGFWFLTIPTVVPARALPPHAANLANGKTMFAAGGCVSCHATPGAKDKTRLGGGLALKSPFGTFRVPNISPDTKDGIGAWTEPQFVTAMIKGTSPDGNHLYPAFPYTSYQRMALGDVRDLFAYIKTLPAVQGRARDHDLPFPFSIRRLLGGWKLLFLDGEPFRPDPSRPPEWNRGAYLVNGPGHCAECHSPRNVLGGLVSSKRFSGGPSPDGEGKVPNITQGKLNKWSVQDFIEVLDTGFTPGSDKVGGAMADVVRNTSELSPADRAAMAIYLKSLPPAD